LRDLAGGSPRARAFAAHALGSVADPTEKPRALRALITGLEDDRPEVRAEAAASLGELKEPGAIPALVKRLDDGVAVVRQNAAIALGSIGHADGFEPLRDALRDGPVDLRFQAATSLAEIDAVRAYEPLVAALDDRDPQVVGAAALSLGAIGDKRIVAHLVTLLDHAESATRFDVAYALAELGDPAGRPILIAALNESDRSWDAVTALATLGAPDDTEALGHALGDRHVAAEATVLAAGTLLRTGAGAPYHEAARRVLLAGLKARKDHIRGLAVEQLAQVGGAWAVEALEKASGKNYELREAVASALQAIEERAK
jgi:HEAT repeat protein